MINMKKLSTGVIGVLAAASIALSMWMPVSAEETAPGNSGTSEEMSIEDIDRTAAAPNQDAYRLYMDKISEYIDKYGERELIRLQDTQMTEYYKGTCYTRLVDFNRDGQEELLLAYLENDDNMQNGSATTISSNGADWSVFWSGVFEARNYVVEVWTYKDGDIARVYEGKTSSGIGGDTNGTYVGTYDMNGQTCLVSGHSIMWGENTLEVLQFDGNSFAPTGVVPDSDQIRHDYVLIQAYGQVPLADEWFEAVSVPVTAAPEETAPEAAEQTGTSAAGDSAGAMAAYMPIINVYVDFLHGGSFDISPWYADSSVIGEVPMSRDSGSLENVVYYIFEDFDGDGTEEMVIGFNDPGIVPSPSVGTENIPFFYSFLWKLVDGQPRLVDYKSMMRGSFLIRQGGYVIDQWGSGGDGIYRVSVWNPTHTENIETQEVPWANFEMVQQDVFNRYPPYIFTAELRTIDSTSGDMPEKAGTGTARELPAPAANNENMAGQATDSGVVKDSDQVFPDSGTRLLKDEEVRGLSPDEIQEAINEIYARRGRLFRDNEIQEHFNAKSWYKGTIAPDQFNDSTMLNATERANIELLAKYRASAQSKGLI